LIERLADGSWRFASYVWNEAGTEATLAPDEGLPRRGIPSRGDCLACHGGAPAPILGYSAVQLERTIAGATPHERAALGYLHGNCGHCHNARALEATGLFLAQSAARPAASAALTRESVAHRADEILRRVASTNPYVRMPPLGVTLADERGLESVRHWIDTELQPQKETSP
jgi:mono/diheme cytochrome c family protein